MAHFRRLGPVEGLGLLEPVFWGDASILSDDVLNDPRYIGVPRGHIPVRSFLGVQLRTELAPAHDALSSAVRHAKDTARGATGSLRMSALRVIISAILVYSSKCVRARFPEVLSALGQC